MQDKVFSGISIMISCKIRIAKTKSPGNRKEGEISWPTNNSLFFSVHWIDSCGKIFTSFVDFRSPFSGWMEAGPFRKFSWISTPTLRLKVVLFEGRLFHRLKVGPHYQSVKPQQLTRQVAAGKEEKIFFSFSVESFALAHIAWK